jgi:hypothetical protein
LCREACPGFRFTQSGLRLPHLLRLLQLKFQFSTQEQPEQENPNNHNPTDLKDDSHVSK